MYYISSAYSVDKLLTCCGLIGKKQRVKFTKNPKVEVYSSLLPEHVITCYLLCSECRLNGKQIE